MSTLVPSPTSANRLENSLVRREDSSHIPRSSPSSQKRVFKSRGTSPTTATRLSPNWIVTKSDCEQSGVPLYEVNPLGASESEFRGSYYEVFLKPVTKPDQVSLGNLALQVLSIQSGGRAFDFNNDLPGLLQKCFSDIAPYYEISFVPDAAERPDEYHSLEVKVSKPGLTVHTRQGYYAQPAHHD